MSFLIVATLVASASLIYWYINRNKTIAQLSRDMHMFFHMQAVGAAGVLDDKIQHSKNKVDVPDLSGKVAVVTGGGRGIGAEVVKKLLNANATVVVGLRNTDAAKKLGNGTKNLIAFQLDLTSLRSVKKFADYVKSSFQEIHYLINNAGVMYVDYELTEDGYETHLAINYLSHFYLTHLLLGKLKAGGKEGQCSRVVNVSSCAHYPAKIYFDDLNFKNDYNKTAAYAQSKLAQIMSARWINRMMEEQNVNVRCYSVHPGVVNTDLFKNTLFSKFPWIMNLVFKTPEQGSRSILYACVSKDIENNGSLYISNCSEGYSNYYSKNVPAQNGLFLESCKMCGFTKDEFGKGNDR